MKNTDVLSNSLYQLSDQDFEIDHPIALMVSHKGGVNLFTQKLDESLDIDPQLISCGLNAFSQFISEAFIIKDKINRITFNDYCILIAEIDELTIYYVYTGNEDISYEKLSIFISEITQTKIWHDLNSKSYQITTQQILLLQKLINIIF